MAIVAKNVQPGTTGLKHSLRFRDLLLYGIVLIQPTAPMPSFGVIYQEARGHVVTAILLAMVAMLFTSVSYGRMARVYPQGGSAFLYVGKEIHPSLGYLTRLAVGSDSGVSVRPGHLRAAMVESWSVGKDCRYRLGAYRHSLMDWAPAFHVTAGDCVNNKVTL